MPPKKKKSALPESEGEDFSDIDSLDSDSSSEDEIPEDTWVFPVVAPQAKRERYEEALKAAQLKVSELQMTVRKLYIQNADLSTRLKKNGRKDRKAQSKKQLSDTEKRVAQLGKLFGVMHEPFIIPKSFAVRPSVDSTHPARYHSELSKIQGITAELYEVVPEDLHDNIVSSPDFRSLFLTQLGSARRSMINQLRSTTAPEIFSQPSKYYKPEYRRSDLPAFQGKLKFAGDDKYTKFPPILFPEGKRKMKKLFRCIELTKMLKSILFGPASLHSMKTPSCIMQGRAWGTTFITPGAIAFMAILAIFLHSPDKEFAPTGAQSKIPYDKWFGLFKEYLMKNATNSEIQKLYMWWNGRVFSFDTAAKDGDGDDEESSGMEEAERCLNASDDSDFEGVLPSKRQDHDSNNTAYPNITDDDFINTFDNLTVGVPDRSNDPIPVIALSLPSSSPSETQAQQETPAGQQQPAPRQADDIPTHASSSQLEPQQENDQLASKSRSAPLLPSSSSSKTQALQETPAGQQQPAPHQADDIPTPPSSSRLAPQQENDQVASKSMSSHPKPQRPKNGQRSKKGKERPDAVVEAENEVLADKTVEKARRSERTKVTRT